MVSADRPDGTDPDGRGLRRRAYGFVYMIVKPLENLMGGLATVRWIHHILMWCFILFIVVHIYMAFWYDVVSRGNRFLDDQRHVFRS